MLERIDELQKQAENAVTAADSTQTLEQIRVDFLGRKAELPNLLRGVADLEPAQRGIVGKQANVARQAITEAIDAKISALAEAELSERLQSDFIDITLPGQSEQVGGLHVITRTRREIEDIFLGLGFSVVNGPEVETVRYNFDSLNHAPNHPARNRSDTFYLAASDKLEAGHERVLRTHTSPMQVRAMQAQNPPIAIIVPGRVYRPDSDATHTPQFHQVEGLWVDENITLSDLKGVLLAFARAVFGNEREIRLRPHFFPFTEPSVEVDVSCFNCKGTGIVESAPGHPKCGLCKATGWIEVLGSGMVDPNVLLATGKPEYDPEKVQGFAFGLGIERIAMLRDGIPDLRLLYENDPRVLEQVS